MRKIHLLAAAGALAVASLPAFAQINLATSRGSFPTTDTVDWSLLGSAFTTVVSPFVIGTTGGSSVTVSHTPGTMFERRDQSTGGWSGNFLPGDALLWNAGDNGAIVFNPMNLVNGAGFNVQPDFYGSFTITIDAYNTVGGLLGSVSRTGNSTTAGDGSAMFIGFTSSSVNVDKFIVSLGGGSSDFALNSLVLSSSTGSAGVIPVPEPSTYGLMGALAVLAAIVHRRLRLHSQA